MVIVTTAVYWGGLSSVLRKADTSPLTFQHRAGVSPYTSSCDLARTCVFSKQSLPPLVSAALNAPTASVFTHQAPPYSEVTGGAFCRVPSPRLSRSPWYSLPNHLSRFRVRAAHMTRSRRFSRQHRITHSPHNSVARPHVSDTRDADLPTPRPTHLPPGQPSPGRATFLRPSAACLLQDRVRESLGSIRRHPPTFHP